jgi:hypothetical protein
MHDQERHLQIKFGIKVSVKLPDPKDWVMGVKEYSKDKQARAT